MKEYVHESEKKYVIGVFVDFQGAFDNLSWVRIAARLRQLECEDLRLWLRYFRERMACMFG